MKTTIATIMLSAFCSFSQSLNSLLDYQTVTNTAIGSTNSVNGVAIPLQRIYFQTGTLTNTSAASLALQVSLDGTNWTTLTNLYRASTNSGIDGFSINATLPVQRRVVVTVSNSIGAGVFNQ